MTNEIGDLRRAHSTFVIRKFVISPARLGSAGVRFDVGTHHFAANRAVLPRPNHSTAACLENASILIMKAMKAIAWAKLMGGQASSRLSFVAPDIWPTSLPPAWPIRLVRSSEPLPKLLWQSRSRRQAAANAH